MFKKPIARYSIFIILAVILVFGYNWWKANQGVKTGEESPENEFEVESVLKQYDSSPVIEIDVNKKYSALLKTSEGDIKLELFVKETPITVNNFVFLAKEGFYNNIKFHRIIKGFMIQGGDPKGDGTGGPGYKFDDELITRDYKRGIMAMANAGPNTNGSQFFIMHQDYNLTKNYVIFGEVIEGIETVDEIAEVPVEKNSAGELSSPKEDVLVKEIIITEE